MKRSTIKKILSEVNAATLTNLQWELLYAVKWFTSLASKHDPKNLSKRKSERIKNSELYTLTIAEFNKRAKQRYAHFPGFPKTFDDWLAYSRGDEDIGVNRGLIDASITRLALGYNKEESRISKYKAEEYIASLNISGIFISDPNMTRAFEKNYTTRKSTHKLEAFNRIN
jgi:hypothetical protein